MNTPSQCWAPLHQKQPALHVRAAEGYLHRQHLQVGRTFTHTCTQHKLEKYMFSILLCICCALLTCFSPPPLIISPLLSFTLLFSFPIPLLLFSPLPLLHFSLFLICSLLSSPFLLPSLQVSEGRSDYGQRHRRSLPGQPFQPPLHLPGKR